MSGDTLAPRSGTVAFLLLACVVIMFGARLFGPSALYRQDQPRTVAYTADIAANGRWLLPRDTWGHTATKPPLVNWLAAPLLKLGLWSEPAVKAPMVLASLVTLALTVTMARRFFGEMPHARDAAFVAGIAWLVNPANINMIYHARPDPVLIALLTAGWMLATCIVSSDGAVALRIVVCFWLCIGLAALTKGPAALLPILYLLLAARLIGGSWARVNRSRWWWGLPLAAAVLLAWAIPCALLYPEPFFDVLVGKEMLAQALGLGRHFGNNQIPSEGPIVAVKRIAENPVWFIERFAPWSLATVGALIAIGWRRWLTHALAPAVLWLLLVLLFFALSAHKTADYIQPAYPAAAVLAAWFCVQFLGRFGVRSLHVAAGGVLLALAFGVTSMFFSSAAREGRGENVKSFAAAAREIIRDEPTLFGNTGYNSLQFFLGRHQGERVPTSEQIAGARWAILPLIEGVPAELLSPPLPTRSDRRMVTVGVYRIEAVRDRLPAALGL